MPRYDLRCVACGHQFEKWVSYDKRHEAVCPSCQAAESEVVFKSTYTQPIISGSSVGQACRPSSGFS